jgi:hypothetical protein
MRPRDHEGVTRYLAGPGVSWASPPRCPALRCTCLVSGTCGKSKVQLNESKLSVVGRPSVTVLAVSLSQSMLILRKFAFGSAPGSRRSDSLVVLLH